MSIHLSSQSCQSFSCRGMVGFEYKELEGLSALALELEDIFGTSALWLNYEIAPSIFSA